MINFSKFSDKIFKSKNGDLDDLKSELAMLSGSASSKEWTARQQASADRNAASSGPGMEILAEAEEQYKKVKRPADYRESERQDVVARQGVSGFLDRVTAEQIKVLNFYLAMCFFMCNIAFKVLDNFFFRRFVQALRPAYGDQMPHSSWISTTGLEDVYNEVREFTATEMAASPGRLTVGIDGFRGTDGRHVMNITENKRGIPSYRGTEWFCRARHDGKTHANAVSKVVAENPSNYLAVVADNTGSMLKMMAILSTTFTCMFFLGCFVHVLDLLLEDIVKIPCILTLTDDIHFIVVFMKTYSALDELFRDESERTFGNKAQSLVIYPQTRFSYASLMMHRVLSNWNILMSVPESPEFRMLKRQAKQKRKAAFNRFEDLVGSLITKKKCRSAVAILEPLSQMLHFLEGDSVPMACIVPLFLAYSVYVQDLPADAGTLLEQEENLEEILLGKVHARWMGGSRTVGLKHPVHGLAYRLDAGIRSAVRYIMGQGFEDEVMASHTQAEVHGAIETYCGGRGHKFTMIIAEFDRYAGGVHPDYHYKIGLTDGMVKAKVAALIQEMDEETKATPILRLINVFKNINQLGSSRAWWASLQVADTESGQTR